MADDEELLANIAKATKESLATRTEEAERLKREERDVEAAKAASLAALRAQQQSDKHLGAWLDEHSQMAGGAKPAHRSPSQQQQRARQLAEEAALHTALDSAAAAAERAGEAEAKLRAEVEARHALQGQLQAEAAARHALQVQLEGVEGGAAEREAVLQAQLATATASAAAAAADAAAVLAAASAQGAQRETELLARLSALEAQARDAQEQARVAEGKVAVMHTTPAALLQELKDVRQELKVQAELKAAELKAQAERERELAVKLGVLEAERARQDRELGAQGEKSSSALQRVGVLESQLAAAAARVVALEAELRAAVLRAAAAESSAAASAAAASSRAQAQAQAPQPSLLLQQQLEYTLRQVQSDLDAERQARQQAISALDAARREGAAAAAAASVSAPAPAPASVGLSAATASSTGAMEVEEPPSPSLAAVSLAESSLAVLPTSAPLLSGIQAALEREDAGWKMWASLERCFVKLYHLHRLPRSVREMRVYAAQLRQEAVMQAAAARKTPHVVRVLGWTEHGAAPSPAPSGSRAPLQWVVGVVQEACSLTLPAASLPPPAAAGGGSASGSASASSSSCAISNLSKLLTHCVLPFGVRLGLARHVAHGLAACALLRLRHRDVKPENVMLCEASPAQGGAAGAAGMPQPPPLVPFAGLHLLAKLGDFGSASQITRDGRTRQGLETASDYTLEFAAPEYLLQKLAREEERERGDAELLRKVASSGALSDEQAAARHFYDQQELPRAIEVLPSVDIFSFGVLLWELVALGGGLDASGACRLKGCSTHTLPPLPPLCLTHLPPPPPFPSNARKQALGGRAPCSGGWSGGKSAALTTSLRPRFRTRTWQRRCWMACACPPWRTAWQSCASRQRWRSATRSLWMTAAPCCP